MDPEALRLLENISNDVLEISDNLLELLGLAQKIQEIGFHIIVLGLTIAILAVIYSVIKKFI